MYDKDLVLMHVEQLNKQADEAKNNPGELVGVLINVRERIADFHEMKAAFEKVKGRLEYSMIPDLFTRLDMKTYTSD